MIERSASKTKCDVTLQAQSVRDDKGKGKWNGNNGRWGYNNSNGRSYQQEGSPSNQKQTTNQSSHIGGVTNRGR